MRVWEGTTSDRVGVSFCFLRGCRCGIRRGPGLANEIKGLDDVSLRVLAPEDPSRVSFVVERGYAGKPANVTAGAHQSK